ncbi:MAG: SMI1/KNR4 family protein [Pseudomonadales bacterium]|jgi:hypothetical protein|nr:SMI1/KNR4 family protein [Pseudomonadales bacterium]
MKENRDFPPVLQELHKLDFDYSEGKGIDFEPLSQFLSAKETKQWIRAWTGNKKLDGTEYKIFGEDGSGGYAAFWLVRQEADILEQPIVFFGSEGEIAVIASNFNDYLWLLAGDIGPCEVVNYPELRKPANAQFTKFAKKYSSSKHLDPWEVVAKAQAEFPDFEEKIEALCE